MIHRFYRSLSSVQVYAICALWTLSQVAHTRTPATQQYRIVSLAPAITETLLELDQGPALVGVTQHCQTPHPVTTVGDGFTVSYELLVELKPDLIFIQDPRLAAAIRKRLPQAKVVTIRLNRLNDIYIMLERLGEHLGMTDAAQRYIYELKQELQFYQDTEYQNRQLLVFGQNMPPYIATSASFVGEILTQLGFKLLHPASSKAYLEVSQEWLTSVSSDLLMTQSPYGDLPTDISGQKIPGIFFQKPSITFIEDVRRFLRAVRAIRSTPTQ